MIMYKFDNIECKLDFDKLLKITTKKGILYKKDFDNFSDFFYFLDTEINQIIHILFDGYEYYLKNGKLHNLYGPAKIKYNSDEEVKNSYFLTNVSNWFYIDGKLICNRLDKRGCRKLEDFENDDIFYWKSLTIEKKDCVQRRLKENVDYIKYSINLNTLRLKDQRKKKLTIINALS